MRIARLENGIVTNIEIADQQWIDAQPDTSVFIPFTDENPAVMGGDFVDGYFYSPQPYPSWVRSTGVWQPPTPMPTDGKKYGWDEDEQAWVETPAG